LAVGRRWRERLGGSWSELVLGSLVIDASRLERVVCGGFLPHGRRRFGGCHAHRFQQLRTTAAAAGVAMVHYDGNKSNKSGSTSGNKRGTKQRSATRKAAIHNATKKLQATKQPAPTQTAPRTAHIAIAKHTNDKRITVVGFPHIVYQHCVLVVSAFSDVPGSRFALFRISLLQIYMFASCAIRIR